MASASASSASWLVACVALISVLSHVTCASASAGTATGCACRGAAANPSVYNFELGGSPAAIISDGRFLNEKPTDAYAEPAYVLDRALRLDAQSGDPLAFGINLLYIDLGGRKLLFDAGMSFFDALFTPGSSGFLFDNLAAAGIARDSITDVFLTHAHLDHVGGLLMPDGETLAFPSAAVHIGQKELDFWSTPAVDLSRMGIPADFQAVLVNTTKKVLEHPGVKAQLVPFPANTTFFDAVTPIETPWHTPGHISFKIAINGDEIFYTGDAVTGIDTTSIKNPWFRLRFDLEQEEGVVGRVKLLEQLAKDFTPIVSYHASFPGYGCVFTNELTFGFKRANWDAEKGVVTKCAT